MSTTATPAKTSPPPVASNEGEPKVHRNLILKGYIKGIENGACEGMCLTLNLAVRGQSMEETERKLYELIAAYLSDAQKSGTWDDLVPRRAPYSYYAEYYYLRILVNFKDLTNFKLFVQSAPCSAHA